MATPTRLRNNQQQQRLRRQRRQQQRQGDLRRVLKVSPTTGGGAATLKPRATGEIGAGSRRSAATSLIGRFREDQLLPVWLARMTRTMATTISTSRPATQDARGIQQGKLNTQDSTMTNPFLIRLSNYGIRVLYIYMLARVLPPRRLFASTMNSLFILSWVSKSFPINLVPSRNLAYRSQ